MKTDLEQQVAVIIKDLFDVDIVIELTRPEEQFGDYSTNAALQLSKQLAKSPREIGEALAVKLRETLGEQISKVTMAGPGFLNFKLSDRQLFEAIKTATQLDQALHGQTIVFEYSDPNPFKVLHAGHLYQTMVGDAVANILEAAGAEVHRVNFGGDVGLHVAKTMWAILKNLGGAYPEKLQSIPPEERSEWLSKAYIEGTRAYDAANEAGANPQVKIDILTLNKIVYNYYSDKRPYLVLEAPCSLGSDSTSLLSENIVEIYKQCRQWSYDYFDTFYASIGSGFEKYYPESITAPIGLKTVQEQLKNGVYEESDGAVVFKGEPYGLHTRVFINSEGLPTYEAKEVGLTMAKWQDYQFDHTIIFTGNDIIEYMKVVLKSIEQFEPELVKRTTHLTHGQVKLAGGMKMSSRKGNILRAQDVLDTAAEAGKRMSMNASNDIVLGAVKYAFIKQTMGPDVIYNPEESISIHGNSGPYLQYAHARAHSILHKLDNVDPMETIDTLNPGERSLARKLSMYPEAFEAALSDYAPHHITVYLYELAQVFNRFYEHNRVIGDPREQLRLTLVQRYAETLEAGLGLLGIAAPEQM
jgi:arginyl-tRNA synthetase